MERSEEDAPVLVPRSPSVRGSLRAQVQRRPLLAFTALAYAWSWAWWLPFVLRGEVVTPGDPWPTHLIGLLGPAIAALVVSAMAGGRDGIRALVGRVVQWRVSPWWYVVAAATIGIGLVVAAFRDGGLAWNEASTYSGTPNLGLGLTFLLVLVLNGFGEEAGWRGFLADRLLHRHGLAASSLIVTAVWGLWHLPLFFLVESLRGLGVALAGWVFGLACGSLVLTWMYRNAGRSILVVALWHTSYNFASGTPLMDGVPAATITTAVMLLAGFLVWQLQHERRQQTPK